MALNLQLNDMGVNVLLRAFFFFVLLIIYCVFAFFDLYFLFQQRILFKQSKSEEHRIQHTFPVGFISNSLNMSGKEFEVDWPSFQCIFIALYFTSRCWLGYRELFDDAMLWWKQEKMMIVRTYWEMLSRYLNQCKKTVHRPQAKCKHYKPNVILLLVPTCVCVCDECMQMN